MCGLPPPPQVYITASAIVKLAHPEGELALTRAAARAGIVQMLPTMASYPLSDIMAAKGPKQPLWFQLYVNPNHRVSEAMVKEAEAGTCVCLAAVGSMSALGAGFVRVW